jgi:hypothetical protein
MAGRPISLRAVRERFFTSLRDACAPWRIGYSGRAPLNQETENAFLRIVVAWETFQSEWLISVVTRDPSQLAKKLGDDFDQWSASKYGISPAAYQGAATPRALKTTLHLASPTHDEVRELLDPRGFNISFDGLQGLKTKSAQFAIAAYLNRVTAIVPQPGQPQAGVVEAATSIRNWLAHRSRSALGEMRGCLAGLHNQDLHVAAFSGSPGGYLKVLVPGAPVVLPLSSAAANPAGIPAQTHPYQRRRLLLYCAEYIRVAWSLVPIQDT